MRSQLRLHWMAQLGGLVQSGGSKDRKSGRDDLQACMVMARFDRAIPSLGFCGSGACPWQDEIDRS
ncbi:hypothetical protein [Undibacterium sp. Ren11W]|uniref:hypothetical protein n=1 Tax=Undibacterium sp. Ren11W TaxID=3413045 RepID=UPI003BF13E64